MSTAGDRYLAFLVARDGEPEEILADEIGHVGFVASRLGRRGRWLMRTLYRALGPRLGGGDAGAVALVGWREVARRFAAEFRLEAMVAELPGRAFAAAAV